MAKTLEKGEEKNAKMRKWFSSFAFVACLLPRSSSFSFQKKFTNKKHFRRAAQTSERQSIQWLKFTIAFESLLCRQWPYSKLQEMGRSRFVVKNDPKVEMDRAHVQSENKKNLKSERCDRNSLYVFFFLFLSFIFTSLAAFVPFYIFFYCAHIKLASLLTLGKGNAKHSEKRTHQTLCRRMWGFSSRLRLSFLDIILEADRPRLHILVEIEVELINKREPHYLRWARHELFLLYFREKLRRLTQAQASEKIIARISIFRASIVNQQEKSRTWNVEHWNFIHQRALLLINEM